MEELVEVEAMAEDVKSSGKVTSVPTTTSEGRRREGCSVLKNGRQIVCGCFLSHSLPIVVAIRFYLLWREGAVGGGARPEGVEEASHLPGYSVRGTAR